MRHRAVTVRRKRLGVVCLAAGVIVGFLPAAVAVLAAAPEPPLETAIAVEVTAPVRGSAVVIVPVRALGPPPSGAATLRDAQGFNPATARALDAPRCTGRAQRTTGLGGDLWCLELSGIRAATETTGVLTGSRTKVTLTVSARHSFAGLPLAVAALGFLAAALVVYLTQQGGFFERRRTRRELQRKLRSPADPCGALGRFIAANRERIGLEDLARADGLCGQLAEAAALIPSAQIPAGSRDNLEARRLTILRALATGSPSDLPWLEGRMKGLWSAIDDAVRSAPEPAPALAREGAIELTGTRLRRSTEPVWSLAAAVVVVAGLGRRDGARVALVVPLALIATLVVHLGFSWDKVRSGAEKRLGAIWALVRSWAPVAPVVLVAAVAFVAAAHGTWEANATFGTWADYLSLFATSAGSSAVAGLVTTVLIAR